MRSVCVRCDHQPNALHDHEQMPRNQNAGRTPSMILRMARQRGSRTNAEAADDQRRIACRHKGFTTLDTEPEHTSCACARHAKAPTHRRRPTIHPSAALRAPDVL
jgi:hypothetical protein